MTECGRRKVALSVVVGLIGLAGPSSASAAVRFAEPDGDGPSGEGQCPQADPCSLDNAVEDPVVADGDEVVILPGDYNLANALVVNDGIELHGAEGLPRPRLIGSSSPVVNAFDPLLRLRDFDIVRTGTASGTALGLGGGTAERLFVHTNPNAGACNLSGPALIRDSVCWGGATGVGTNQSSGSATGSLRNVTAVGASSGISVSANVGNITYEAKNVIASGAVDVRAEGDASGTATVNLDHSNYDTELEEDFGGSGDAAVTDPGSGSNQLAAPVLAAASNGDFHQLAGSPTIDAGTGDPLLGALDLDGEPRVHGTAPDIGADEFTPPALISPVPGDTTPPETTITKRPKDKTKRKQATFEFTSSKPGSSFVCTLDGKQEFKPCSSPLTVKVKKGRHTFQVQAIDQAGNTDSTPASDSWKRKRKRKRK